MVKHKKLQDPLLKNTSWTHLAVRYLMRTLEQRLPLSDSQLIKGQHQVAASCEAELAGVGDVLRGSVHSTQFL